MNFPVGQEPIKVESISGQTIAVVTRDTALLLADWENQAFRQFKLNGRFLAVGSAGAERVRVLVLRDSLLQEYGEGDSLQTSVWADRGVAPESAIVVPIADSWAIVSRDSPLQIKIEILEGPNQKYTVLNLPTAQEIQALESSEIAAPIGAAPIPNGLVVFRKYQPHRAFLVRRRDDNWHVDSMENPIAVAGRQEGADMALTMVSQSGTILIQLLADLDSDRRELHRFDITGRWLRGIAFDAPWGLVNNHHGGSDLIGVRRGKFYEVLRYSPVRKAGSLNPGVD